MGSLRFAFHVDVGREEGWGHLRESLAVAKALDLEDVATAFILPDVPEALREVRDWGYVAETLPQGGDHGQDVLRVARRTSIDCVVSNLVEVSAALAETLRGGLKRWAVITEHTEQELAEVSFNICRRPEYMPLAPGYRDAIRVGHRDELGSILVCFGGSDPKNGTGMVLEMLRQGFERGGFPRGLRLTVVLGPLFEHGAVMKAMIPSYPAELDVVGPIDVEAMVREGHRADLGVATGGGNMYEFCALGLPTVIVPILDKMVANATVLAERGAVHLLPRVDRLTAAALIDAVHGLVPVEARGGLGRRAAECVDGRGAERIAESLVKQWSLT